MKKKVISYKLKLFLSTVLVLMLLAIISIKAALITFFLVPQLLIIYQIANKSNNKVLICFVFFFAFTNLVGVPHAILNADTFQYSGWKAVKDFNFSYSEFLRVYSVAFLSVFLLVLFVYILGKTKTFFTPLIQTSTNTNFFVKKRSLEKSYTYSILIVFLLVIVVLASMIGFENRVGMSGVEPEKLPYKLVGILFFGRSLLVPFLIFWLIPNIQLNWLLRFIIILSALMIGIYSGSRGTTLFYLLPLILDNLQKINFGNIFFKLFLLIAGFTVATASQAIYTLMPGLSWTQQLSALFIIGLDPYESVGGSFVEFTNQILGIAHRFYGFQDYVLAAQHFGYISIMDFFSFVLSGNPDYLVPDITSVLYGLEFPEGTSYGVAMGWVGLSIASFNSSIIIAILLIFYLAFLIVLANRILIRFQALPLFKNFDVTYLVLSLMISLILISGRIDFFYLVISIIWVLKFFLTFSGKLIKSYGSNQFN